jgi:3-isopropylmalate dehydrogenase
MLLKYSLNMHPEASAVEEAVRRTINRGVRTVDIGGSASTSEVGDAVAGELAAVLQERFVS